MSPDDRAKNGDLSRIILFLSRPEAGLCPSVMALSTDMAPVRGIKRDENEESEGGTASLPERRRQKDG